MKKIFILFSVFAVTALVYGAFSSAEEQGGRGEALFKQHCSPCHAGGGNAINPKKTLHKKDREAYGVNDSSDIVRRMRNPGPGMTKFDETMIPDKDAKEIAEYILKTF